MSRTYTDILTDGLNNISDNILKSEGSLVYNAVSIIAYELERVYQDEEYLINQLDPDTADFDNLKKLCAQRGIYPKDATNTIVKIEGDATIPIGARFNLGTFNYIVTEVISDASCTYKAQCETAGKAPNNYTGTLTPITYVEGLTSARITEILVEGTDASTQSDMLKEYKESFNNSSFGGNVEQYKEEINKFDGIGGCKIYPVWNGGGTVKAVLISSDYNTVSDELISEIQEEMCPTPKKGYGISAIGHDTTVESVKAKVINISTTITFTTGSSWDTLKEKITAAVESYLLSLRETWSDGDELTYITVYISRIEAKILEIEGILDIGDTTINESSSNLALSWDEIPTLGEISHA